MTPHEAAERLRPTFHLESMPTEDRHHVKFVEDVATELDIEHTAFNLHQVASALDAANIHEDSNEYPKMLFSRKGHETDGEVIGVYDPRHDFFWVHADTEDDAKALGKDWIDSIDKLSPSEKKPT